MDTPPTQVSLDLLLAEQIIRLCEAIAQPVDAKHDDLTERALDSRTRIAAQNQMHNLDMVSTPPPKRLDRSGAYVWKAREHLNAKM